MKNPAIWIVSASVALVTYVVSAAAKVRQFAASNLRAQAAKEQLQIEQMAAMNPSPESEVAIANARVQAEINDARRRKSAESFDGAHATLSAEQRRTAVAYGIINSVAMGGVTLLAGHLLNKGFGKSAEGKTVKIPGRRSSGASYGDGAIFYSAADSSAVHHGHSWLDIGHGGFFGDGGHGGGFGH